MKRRFILMAVCLVTAIATIAQPRAKYVFYFIGDGMGVNQINGTETYMAALQGRIGVEPLLMTQFPTVSLVTTFSATNGVTDSAAAGTALATGKKTKNGALGVLKDLTTPVTSVAVWAQNAGAAVGVATNVSVDHATPAAFYAHVPKRGMYHEISADLVRAGFDFYAGSDFRKPIDKKDTTGYADIWARCKDAGYTVVRGYNAYLKARKDAGRLILFQPEKPSNGDRTCLPYAIDRRKGDLTLTEITRAATSFLMQKQTVKDGFFLMVEGGKVDYACHANDVATAFKEVMDLDRAVRVAYEFYQQHPDETLIVITADHETGGIVLGRGPYELHTELLANQRMSAEEYSRHLQRLHERLGKDFTWERVARDLKENWGFDEAVPLTDHQRDRLHRAYNQVVEGRDKGAQNLYATLDGIADAARRTMAECALIGWQSGGHSNGYVPLFAVGVGADRFTGKIDNTEIPLRIAAAAGWKVPEQ